jgi:hypothetical protein
MITPHLATTSNFANTATHTGHAKPHGSISCHKPCHAEESVNVVESTGHHS